MENEKRKKPIVLWVATILVGIFVISLIIHREKGILYLELNKLKLIPQSEHFTELYFENSSLLPRETVRGQEVSFSFTIHNVEGATTTYPYRVYFVYPAGYDVTFATGSVSLADNASTTISVSHMFLEDNEQGMVVVDLTSLDQTIDFLLPDNN